MIEVFYAKAIGSVAGHTGPADPQDHRQGTASRLGNRQANPDPFGRRALGGPGVAVPRAAPAGAARLDHRGMEGFRSGPLREILRPDARGTRATGARAQELG